MLENYDEDWIFRDADRRRAEYTRVSPGSYVFRVKGSNNNGIWNEAGTSLGIVVTPPFTQTLFFKTLMVVLTILIIYLIILFFISTGFGQSKLSDIIERYEDLEKELSEDRTMPWPLETDEIVSVRIEGYRTLLDELDK